MSCLRKVTTSVIAVATMNTRGRRSSRTGGRRGSTGKPQTDIVELDLESLADNRAAWIIKYYIEKFRRTTNRRAFAGEQTKFRERIAEIEK